MATVNSVGYTNANATPPTNEKPSVAGGRVRVYYDEYTQGAADGSIGDIIQFRNLPEGARVLPGGKCFFGTGNASATLKIGVTGADATLKAATAITTAGNMALEDHLAGGLAYTAPAGGIAVIATNAVAAIKAAQKIAITLLYAID